MMLSSTLFAAHIYDACWCLGCGLCALAAAKLCVELFNALPAKWFCDYNEQPGGELYEKRIFFRPHGIMMALILTAAFICMYYQYTGKTFLFFACCFVSIVLLMIGTADYKYYIIPDQFTIALLLTAAAIICCDILSKTYIFSTDWLSPLYGAAAGVGLMLVLALVGKLCYKKDAMGFGDVKLFGVIGLFAGFPHVFIVFLLTIFLAFFHIIYLLLHRKILKDTYLPLGPYLCLGLFLFLAFNRQINCFLNWYTSLLGF